MNTLKDYQMHLEKGQELINHYGHLFRGLKKTMRFHHPRMVQGLIDWCKLIPEGATGIEIGCFAGESTLILTESIHNLSLICVDPWLPDYYSDNQIPKAEECFDYATTRQRGKPFSIDKVKMTSDDFFDSLIKNNEYEIEYLGNKGIIAARPEKVDFVYIDGCHKSPIVDRDILNALKVIKPGGILGGHDYNFKGSPDVIKALLEVMGREADFVYPDYSFAYRV